MGRHEKQVGTAHGIDRRDSGHHSTPHIVAQFIASTLKELGPEGQTALDPCVGNGEMALPLIKLGIDVDGLDILPFMPPQVNFRLQDFLQLYADEKVDAILGRRINLGYDFYVANPPYNCHEVDYVRSNKITLSRLFPDIGVHNMCSMFMSAIIECAKPGSLIGVIILDSFLTARAHKALREQILRECAIHYLLLCPTDLFRSQGADVRTCIIILQKGKEYQAATVRVLNRRKNIAEFEAELEAAQFPAVALDQVATTKSGELQFVVGTPNELLSMLDLPSLGSQFRCVTGISTGDDKKYLSRVQRSGFSIPFFKNPGARKFYAEPNAFLTDDFLAISDKVSNFIVRNKDILFMPGITCSSMGVAFSACYLPKDSAFGVNPNIIVPEEDAWWLISYLNTHLVTCILRGVLIRSNMVTSGYVSRLPIPAFSRKAKQELTQIARSAHASRPTNGQAIEHVALANSLVESELSLSADTVKYLREFNGDLVRST